MNPFILFLASITTLQAFEPQYILPRKYLAFSNPAAGQNISPFSGQQFTYFHVEDFEDGFLNTPGVTLLEAADMSGPQPVYSDSVDGDDGSIDGIATNTQSLFSNYKTSSFTFTFSRNVLGALPTHAGLVWTDIGRNNGGTPLAADLINNVTFEAFGPHGVSLGPIGPFSLGDSSITRTTDEDRFIGVINLQGISAIKISMPGKNNWEIDHVQYGFSNPAPQISLTKESNGNLRLDYIGILESSPSLIAGSWFPVTPTPANPLVFTPTSHPMFFRARRAN